MKRNMGFTPIPPCMIGTWAWGSGMNGARMIFGKKYDDQQLIDTYLHFDNSFPLDTMDRKGGNK